LSGSTRVSRYRKGKTNLDFTGARDSEWQWYQLGMCKSAPHSRQITTPAPQHSVFYRPDALSAAQPTASKHRRPKRAFTDQKKCTTMQNEQKLKPGLVAFYDIWPGKGAGPFTKEKISKGGGK